MHDVYTQYDLNTFTADVWNYYKNNKRIFRWRNADNPYWIVVSEIMLQQTQTFRVAPKFDSFIEIFPSWHELAQADTQKLLFAWQGLGYNRRALGLRLMAQKICVEFNGHVPQDPTVLKTFYGIGPNTAGSICAFAFNMPIIFIETNIRAVFIHHFFLNQDTVHDKEILPLIAATLDQKNPREWYYALMDYGVMLKKEFKNPARKSKHHTTQSTFNGSDRQIRGKILKVLTQKNMPIMFLDLKNMINLTQDSHRLEKIITQLKQDGFIEYNDQHIVLKN